MNYLSLCGEVSDLKFEMTIKVLAQKVLQLAKLDMDSYRVVFNRYVLGGIFNLEQVYRDEIYEGENSWALRSEEDVFFMFMRKAFAYKELDSKKYFEYLKKAVNACPSMKKGIEILVEDFEREIETKEASTKIDNPELKAYEVMFKEKIDELINLGQLANAKLLIEEYLKIVPGDAEMIMLRSEI